MGSEHLHRQLLSPITQRSFRSCHWGWFHSVTRTIALAATFLYSGMCTSLLVAVLAHMCTSNLASLRLRLGVLSMAALPVHHQGATGGGSRAACRTAGLPAGAARRLRGHTVDILDISALPQCRLRFLELHQQSRTEPALLSNTLTERVPSDVSFSAHQ